MPHDKVSRRSFFGAVAALAAVPVVVSATPEPVVEYARNMTGITWVDWQKPINQNVLLAYWVTKISPDEYGRDLLVSTTFGQVQRLRAMDMINFSLDHDWPIITVFSTDDEKYVVRQRALDALCLEMYAAR